MPVFNSTVPTHDSPRQQLCWLAARASSTFLPTSAPSLPHQAVAALEASMPRDESSDGEGGGGGGKRRAGDGRSATWRSFWASHQAFFRNMTMAAKASDRTFTWLSTHVG